MSINLEEYVWPTSFVCNIVTEKIILPNQYNINISIEPVSPTDLALGFRRLRTFIDSCLNSSIFICNTHFLLDPLLLLDTNKVCFNTEPYDYSVGSTLFRKFQSITSNYFDIGFIIIDSNIGDHIQYCIKDPEESGLDLSGDYWWNMDNLDTGVGTSLTWNDLDLQDSPKFEPRIIKGGRSEKQ